MFSLNALRTGSASGYFPSLTLLRGVAVVLVLLFHLVPHESVSGIFIIDKIVCNGFVGLDMFFIISGFIVPYSMWRSGYTLRHFPKFVLKRLVRLEPPYLASIAFVIVMRYVAALVHGWGYEVDWVQLLTHIGYLNGYLGYESLNTVYWTLAIEFQFYILVGLTFVVLVTRYKWISLLFLLVVVVAGMWIYLPYNLFLLQYANMFVIGILLFLFAIEKINVVVLSLSLTSMLALLLYRGETEVLVCAIFTISLLLFSTMKWKLTTWLGSISYSLYLTHTESAMWFQHYIQDHLTNKFWLHFLSIVVAFIFAWIFHLLFEKPALQWSRQIAYKRTD